MASSSLVRSLDAVVRGFNQRAAKLALAGDSQGIIDFTTEMSLADLKPDAETYSHLVSACLQRGEVNGAFEVLDLMVTKGVTPQKASFDEVIYALGGVGDVGRAFRLIEKMRELRVHPNDVTFRIAVKVCCKAKKLDKGLEMLAELRPGGAPRADATKAIVWAAVGEKNPKIVAEAVALAGGDPEQGLRVATAVITNKLPQKDAVAKIIADCKIKREKRVKV
jgi:pentatricopeptide repeat protein